MPPPPRTNHDLIVIGAGLAGLAAATEAARCGLDTVIYEGEMIGGLIVNIGSVHGHPGLADTGGAALASAMLGEALAAGASFTAEAVEGLTAAADHWSVATSAGTVTTRQVVLATGARLRRLGVPGEAELTGRGVSQCAFCDGGLYRDREVAVVGGGDAAFQEALHLAELCRTVTMILRGRRPRARPALIGLAADCENIAFRWTTTVREIIGDGGVSALRLVDEDLAKEEILPIAAVFPFVGTQPNTDLAPAELPRDPQGGLIVDAGMQTPLPGLYAVGAARAAHGGQAAHAIADGKTAAHSAWRGPAG
jgi:thioredoxin reductase (NADPH)